MSSVILGPSSILVARHILSFDPKNTDVDEHIDLINTQGDMVDQKEEAKMEKFIETMPTMIQTHLITCKIGLQ